MQPYVAGWRERGLDVVLVTYDTAESIEVFFQKNKLSYPVLLDRTGEAGKAYNVRSIPLTVFIDAEGKVRQTHLGWGQGALETFKSEVDKRLS